MDLVVVDSGVDSVVVVVDIVVRIDADNGFAVDELVVDTDSLLGYFGLWVGFVVVF